jgi:hypothetical protein
MMPIGQFWSIRHTARTWPQAITTSSDQWSTFERQGIQKCWRNFEGYFFDSKDRQFYRHGIFMLPDMWLNVIDSEEDYFDY